MWYGLVIMLVVVVGFLWWMVWVIKKGKGKE